MTGILITQPKRPSRKEAFARARAALADVEAPTRTEIRGAYRAALEGTMIVIRCHLSDNSVPGVRTL